MTRHIRTIALCAPTFAIFAFLGVQHLHAYPGDVFVAGAPTKGPDLENATEVESDSYSVATQTGAAQYSYPIDLPPGRVGLKPGLSLNYSSQAPLRGGIAAGWSLGGVPKIEVDTSQGRLAGVRYRSSLAGGQPLVPVDEPGASDAAETYRARNDSSYARYERYLDRGEKPGYWRVLRTDGTIMYFGETSESRDNAENWDLSDAPEARWFLTRVVDRNGNEIRYSYETVKGSAFNGAIPGVLVDIALTSIEYNHNPDLGLEPHARVRFEYAPGFDLCPGSDVPIGARFNYRTGFRLYEGARRLDAIVVEARQGTGAPWTPRRRISLSYDEQELACNAPRAPLRLLTSIDETAFAHGTNTGTSPPPVAFDYERSNRRELDASIALPIDPTGHIGLNRGLRRLNPNKPGGWPTVDTKWVDVNGDARLDVLRSMNGQSCEVEHLLTEPMTGGWDLVSTGSWPELLWANDPGEMKEGCNLGFQLSRRGNADGCSGHPANYTSYRIFDIDGDGTPELVTALDYKQGKYDPEVDSALLHSATMGGVPTCAPTSNPCRTGTGEAVLCKMDPRPRYEPEAKAAEDEEPDTGGGDDPEDHCEEPDECVWPGCYTPGQDPSETLDPYDDLSCRCAMVYCDSEEDGVTGRWARPEPGANWVGPPWTGGDVGGEGSRPDVDNPGCAYAQELQEDCGRYIWRVYEWDDESASFQSQYPEIVLSPVPLESDRATSPTSFELPATASSWHGLVDIDGDSCLDAVWQQPIDDDDWNGDFQVFLGDCHGGFHATPSGEPYYWPTPELSVANDYEGRRPVVSLQRTGFVSNRETADELHRWTHTAVTLTDVNGDGLPDYVVNLPHSEDEWTNDEQGLTTAPLRVYYNTGTRFEQSAIGGTVLSDHINALARDERVILEKYIPTGHLKLGYRMNTLSQSDLDFDGLVDVAELPPPPEGQPNPWSAVQEDEVVGHFNVGDRLIPVEDDGHLEQYAYGLANIMISDGNTWVEKTAVRDFNGDGLPEVYSNEDGSQGATCDPGNGDWGGCGTDTGAATGSGDATGRGRPLLRAIDNGLGLEVDFNYGSSADPDLVQITGDARLPQPVWVVRSMEVSISPKLGPGDANVGRTDYVYRDPVYNVDPDGRHGFRGFDEVWSAGPVTAGNERAVTMAAFDYDLDYSGRQVESRTYSASDEFALDDRIEVLESELDIESISETELAGESTFGGKVRTYHVAEARERTCDDAINESDHPVVECKTSGALKRTVNEWLPVYPEGVSGGVPDGESDVMVPIDPIADDGAAAGSDKPPALAFVRWSARLTDAPGAVRKGDRGSYHYYRIESDADTHHLLPTRVRRYEATSDGVGEEWGDRRLIGHRRTIYDGLGRPKETRVQIDMEVPHTWAITTRQFTDAGNLFTRTKPEQKGAGVKKVFRYEPFEVHVDETINEAGHAYETVTDMATGLPLEERGPFQPSHGWPGVRTHYDGFGRVLSRDRTRDDGNGGYEWVTVFTAEYTDGPLVKATTRERIAYDEDRWVEKRVVFDGAGRPYRERIKADGEWGATDYHYDPAGNVVRVETPNPANDGSGPAVYRYRHDALGRVVHHEPAAGAPVRFSYDGLKVTTRQYPTDETPPRHVTHISDPFGRLRTVREHRPLGLDAVTEYRYDGNDNMRYIVDADGIETYMRHDLVGNRVSVERAGRTWEYAYDRNGNMIAEVAPYEGEDEEAISYTTSITYDVLDRVDSKDVPPRKLPEVDEDALERYGIVEDGVEFIYDYDDTDHANGKGRLTRVDLPYGADAHVAYEYTAEGWVSEETRKFRVSPFGAEYADERTIKRTYNAMGAPVRTVHADGPDDPSETLATYDDRGLPDALYLHPVPEDEQDDDGGDGGGGGIGGGIPGDIGVDPGGVQSFAAPTFSRPTRSVAGFVKTPSAVHAEAAPEPQQTLLARLTRNRAGVVTRRVSDFAQAQTWQYDVLGRVTHNDVRLCSGQGLGASQSCAQSGTASAGEHITYWSTGNVHTVTDPGTGNTLAYTYDGQQQLATAQSSPDVGDYAANFTYSPAGRVQSAYIGGTGPGVLERDATYVYPSVGNDKDQDPAAVQALEPNSDELPLEADFEYDLRGNLVRRTVDGTTWTFVYDGDDRLREARRSDGSREVYYYDHDGQRMVAVSTSTSEGDTPRARFWFGETEITYDDTGTVDRRQVYFGLGALSVARLTRDGSSDPELELTYSGVLGSLLAVADEQSDLVAAYRYGPYGEILEASGPAAADFRRRYNGKELDSLTDLGYYGFRYYDRLTLTWTQADPLYRYVPDLGYEEPRRMGLYTFNLNNPLRYVDPNGLDVIGWLGGVAEGAWEAAVDTGKSVAHGVTHPVETAEGAWDAVTNPIDTLTGMAEGLKQEVKAIAEGDPRAFGRLALSIAITRKIPGAKRRGRRRSKKGDSERDTCFPGDTLVVTDRGRVAIEDVEVGDRVACADPSTGTWELCVVRGRSRHQYSGELVQVEIEGSTMESTVDHPYWVVRGADLEARPGPTHTRPQKTKNGRWVDARDLRVGDTVLLASGTQAQISSIADRAASLRVFNLDVGRWNSYAVGDPGVLVHNKALDIVARARNVIADLPDKLFQPLRCVPCADGLVSALKKKGISGEILEIRTRGASNIFMQNDLVSTNRSITRNGYHRAVRVGDTVFDNELRGGVPYQDYVDSIYAPEGVDISSTPF